MFSYLIDYDLKLALPRPEIDGPLLFEQIETSRDSLAAFLPWVATTLTADDEINFLAATLKSFGEQRALHLVLSVSIPSITPFIIRPISVTG